MTSKSIEFLHTTVKNQPLKSSQGTESSKIVLTTIV